MIIALYSQYALCFAITCTVCHFFISFSLVSLFHLNDNDIVSLPNGCSSSKQLHQYSFEFSTCTFPLMFWYILFNISVGTCTVHVQYVLYMHWQYSTLEYYFHLIDPKFYWAQIWSSYIFNNFL